MRWRISARRSRPPRKSIDERVLSGAALEDLVDDLMDEVRTLDEDMKAFKLLDRPLFDGYEQMRKIIDSGGGRRRPGEGWETGHCAGGLGFF